MNCRHCKQPLTHTFLDLGFSPLSNAYLSKDDLNRPEIYYPLKVRVCENCFLVQTEDYADCGELFKSDYAYFSSTSTTWLTHAQNYAAQIIELLKLDSRKLVIEVAANDGYLLKNFVASGIPCLGIEPTASTAAAAEKLGIPVLREFFGEALGQRLAKLGKKSDLIIGNNVYAHVPDINDFTRGLKAALKPTGTITLEFPHLLQLIKQSQFDTVYHEHFSYLSLGAVSRVFQSTGLRVYAVDQISTHGGSLRVFGCHADDPRQDEPSVKHVWDQEDRAGMRRLETYLAFQPNADRIKNELLAFLIEQKRVGKKVAAYGAAAKGNTLLNYAGVKPDLLPFVCDAAPSKQGKFLPGSHIPILPPSSLNDAGLDFLLILPWNISEEIRKQNVQLENAGTKFLTVVPELVWL